MATKLVTIVCYGSEWIRPENIIKIRDYKDYTVEFLRDSPTNQRLKLYKFTYEVSDEKMLQDFSDLQPVLYAQTLGDFVLNSNKTKFEKLYIRRAMRILGIEDKLDLLLANNEIFKKDWSDAVEVDLADPIVQQGLVLLNIDINAIKVAIENL